MLFLTLALHQSGGNTLVEGRWDRRSLILIPAYGVYLYMFRLRGVPHALPPTVLIINLTGTVYFFMFKSNIFYERFQCGYGIVKQRLWKF